MIKKLFFFFFFCYSFLTLIGQEDEYVINQPKTETKTPFHKLKSPDYTNYLLSSSSHTLKKRDIRIANTDIIFSKGSYGLTDNTTASLSISLIGGLTASIKQKINLANDVNLGFSGSIGRIANLPTDSFVFLTGGQAMITLGDIQNNITFGIGVYYAKSSFKLINEEKEFLLSNVYIATQKQIGRRVYLIAEGIYFNNYNTFTGAIGTKITVKKTMTIGAGIMPIAFIDRNINTSNTQFNALPLLSFRMLLDRN